MIVKILKLHYEVLRRSFVRMFVHLYESFILPNRFNGLNRGKAMNTEIMEIVIVRYEQTRIMFS